MDHLEREPHGRRTGPGTLVISVDLEMLWGVDGVWAPGSAYGANLQGVRNVVPALLDLFEEFDIHATWAVVGMLMARDRADLETLLPRVRPAYRNKVLDPYRRLSRAWDGHDRLRFAPDLVAAIAGRAGQEIGTHTFSHYYCLEPGQDREAFAADLDAALRVAAREGYRIRSLVFPGNQYREAYLDIVRDRGILAFRGNRGAWAYRPGPGFRRPLRRWVRLVDDYARIPGHTPLETIVRGGVPFNIPESFFWAGRPRHLGVLDGLRIKHVARGMVRAAEAGGVYHLWWHPHNFGADPAANLKALRRLFWVFRDLRERGCMGSRAMGELAESLLRDGADAPGGSDCDGETRRLEMGQGMSARDVGQGPMPRLDQGAGVL